MGARGSPSWLEDFSIVLTRHAMRSYRRAPEYEVFAGSKPLSILWLAAISAVAGAFGGTLVSGALWLPLLNALLQVPLWLAAMVGFCIVTRWATLKVSGPYLAFLTGWCIGWGLLIGICAMWAAQLSGSGWAYGVAIGVGFLIGITQGVYEPEDLDNHDSFFGLGMVTAIAGACFGAWVYRNTLSDPGTLPAAALTGGLAGLVFLAPVMALLLARLKNVEGLKRLAALLLHNDETAAESLPLLADAIRLSPDDAALLARRGFAHALLGRTAEAEADFVRHESMAPNSAARDIADGWRHLRRDRAAEAAISFGKAAARHKRNRAAALGLGLARLRLQDARGAIAALETIADTAHDARSMSYLAEAHLLAGDTVQAEQLATVAIDELDSVHGYSWLIRGDAFRAMGDIDSAAKDYNGALWADDETGMEERALARLDEIGRPVEEDYEPE
jgi:tetratricopeptide (TPR) repeat protein